MVRNLVVFLLILVFFFGGFSSVSASTPPVKIVTGVVSHVVSALVKWLWSLKASTETAVSSSSMMRFEGGYTVETVFDGSKFGMVPFSVAASPSGELLVLDSENSNIYKISTPLSKYSRPKIVAGSPEGYYGHVDGRPREARMNRPKGLTVDDRGNIYIADTLNMAIRKISDTAGFLEGHVFDNVCGYTNNFMNSISISTGVTTIAGGKWSRGVGHVDGPSEDAKFSNDFDVVYIGSSCSLLVIDRGNQAIREIQLHYDDCSNHYDGSFHLGIFVLAAAAFFGYMLALLQRRVRVMFSSKDDSRTPLKRGPPMVAPYQRPSKSARPPLIPTEDDFEKPEGFFGSIGSLVLNTGSTVGDIFAGLFSGFRRKPDPYQLQHQYLQRNAPPNTWHMQESNVIPDDDNPPSIETRTPTPKKTYPYMTKESEKRHYTKQSQAYYNGWEVDYHHEKQQQMQNQLQQHHHRHLSPHPQTYYEKSRETNEIVFGAVQEQDGRREAVVIKAVDYGDPRYNHHNVRPRSNYTGHSNSYSHGY